MGSTRPSRDRSRARRWLPALAGLGALAAAATLVPAGSLPWQGSAWAPPAPGGHAGPLQASDSRDRREDEPASRGAAAASGSLLGASLERAPVGLWEITEDSVHAFDHPIGDYRPERHALRLDPGQVGTLGVGDQISLPIPGLGTLVATIEHVETTPLGSLGLSGSLDGFDSAYAVTLTQGHTALFGRITTPYGNYLLEGTGGAASIYADDLDQLIDPDQSDELLPPEPGEEPA